MRDVQLFFPEVRHGGVVVTEVPHLGLGDALRARVQEIVARPPRVGFQPARNAALDGVWRQVRMHHHVEFGLKVRPNRLPHDRRNRVALSHGIAEVVVEALFAPVYGFLLVFNDRLRQAAELARPADVDFWAPRRRRT